jgi:hypothetical protein
MVLCWLSAGQVTNTCGTAWGLHLMMLQVEESMVSKWVSHHHFSFYLMIYDNIWPCSSTGAMMSHLLAISCNIYGLHHNIIMIYCKHHDIIMIYCNDNMIWVCLKIGRHEIPWSRIPVEFLFPLTWTQPKDPYCWLMLLDVGCTFIIIYPSQLMFLIFAVQSRLTRWFWIRPVEFHIAIISPWNAHWVVGYINLRLSLFLHLNFLHMFHGKTSVSSICFMLNPSFFFIFHG